MSNISELSVTLNINFDTQANQEQHALYVAVLTSFLRAQLLISTEVTLPALIDPVSFVAIEEENYFTISLEEETGK